MASQGSNSKKPSLQPATQSRKELDSDDERDETIAQLKRHAMQVEQKHAEQEARSRAIEEQITNLINQMNQNGAGNEVNLRELRDRLDQTEYQVGASAPTSTNGLKLPKADTFEGNRSKLKGFLTQMHMHLHANRNKMSSEADKVIFIATHLKGMAWDWIEPFMREYYKKTRSEWSATTSDMFTSCDKFVEQLERTFGDINETEQAIRKLQNIRQTGAVSNYIAEFMRVSAILGWDDYALIPYFHYGLKSGIKDELARDDRPNNMKDYITKVTKIDDRWYDRQMEKKEVEQFRRGNHRGPGRFQPRGQRYEANQKAPRHQDPYGPRPMELDAIQLPRQEQDRRKKERLCFKCGKPGHMIKDCRVKTDDSRKQQLRATQEMQQLRASQEEQDEASIKWNWLSDHIDWLTEEHDLPIKGTPYLHLREVWAELLEDEIITAIDSLEWLETSINIATMEKESIYDKEKWRPVNQTLAQGLCDYAKERAAWKSEEQTEGSSSSQRYMAQPKGYRLRKGTSQQRFSQGEIDHINDNYAEERSAVIFDESARKTQEQAKRAQDPDSKAHEQVKRTQDHEWPEQRPAFEEMTDAWEKLDFARRQLILNYDTASPEELLNWWGEQNLEEVRKACAASWRTGEDFPEIEEDYLESQGWTQYGPWNQPSDSQEWTAMNEGSHKALPGTNTIPGSPAEIPETPPTILDTPRETPKTASRQTSDDTNEKKQKQEWPEDGWGKVPRGGHHLTTTKESNKAEDWGEPSSGTQYLAADRPAAAWGAHLRIKAHILQKPVSVLIDSGCTGIFMSPLCAQWIKIRPIQKLEIQPVLGLHGEVLSNGITHESGNQVLNIKGHVEVINFNVMPLGKYDIVLGIPWLKKHNPEVDWRTGKLELTRCDCQQIQEIRGNTNTRRGSEKGADAYENARLRKREKDSRPMGKARQTMDVDAVMTTEFNPEWSDEELHEYVQIHHGDLHAVCATDEEKLKIPERYKEYEDVFTSPPLGELPEHGPFDFTIELEEGKQPTYEPVRHLPEKHRQALKDFIRENLEKGYIRESKSSAAYPVTFAPKKDGTVRVCIDYRRLNEITKKDRHPLPLIIEIQMKIGRSKFFTKFDITNAFNRLRVMEGMEWMMAFITPFGLFEPTVMMFGLTNAPAAFQRFMFWVLREFLGIFVEVYLDDIIVHSETEEEHEEHVKQVLQKLREAKVILKLKKCEFHVTETTFLGYVITKEGFAMQEGKVQSILEWPAPKNVKEVQQFMGLCNYYRRSIPAFSGIGAPLTKLTKKDQKWQWEKEEEEAFNKVKEQFEKRPVVAPFDPELPITLETDASDFAVGAVMTQPHEVEGKIQQRPIAFHSRKMIPAELNYPVYDKELLAIVNSFKIWRAFLYGAKHQILVKSDHKNLTYFKTTKELTGRQARWNEVLSEYDFKIEHCAGTANGRADALSRRPDYQRGVKEASPAILKDNEDGTIGYNHQILAATSVLEDTNWIDRIKEATARDEALQSMRPEEENKNELFKIHGLIYIPGELRQEVIKKHHDSPEFGHMGVEKTAEHISRNYYMPNLYRKVRSYVRKCDSCQRNKPTRHSPYGKLQLTEIPQEPWEWITIDFIVKLPLSDEKDSIIVIVDKLTKYAYMIATREDISAEEMAWILVRYVFTNHGTPKKITSDRGPVFTSKMWKSFNDIIGTILKLSTAYHPQTNGQTERTNQTLEQYLRHYVNYQQDNWAKLLPTAQFAYNNAMHATTQETPFFANYGRNPSLAREPIGEHAIAETARLMVTDIKHLHLQLARDIEFLNLRMKMYYDRNHEEGPDLKRGEKVYLLRRNIRTKRPSDKLDHKRLGPFTIEEKTGPVNYKLRLPESMKRIYPVFHISLLEPAPENAQIATNVEIEDASEEEYEVEEILADRWYDNQQQLLVKWQGYPTSENTWEPIAHLRGCHQLVQRHYQKAKKTPEGRKMRQHRHQRIPTARLGQARKNPNRKVNWDSQTQSTASE